MLGLHNKPTMQATMLSLCSMYQKQHKKPSLYICDNKEMCSMLRLHNKPTLTSRIFNAGFNALRTKIRNHLLCNAYYLFGNAYSQYIIYHYI